MSPNIESGNAKPTIIQPQKNITPLNQIIGINPKANINSWIPSTYLPWSIINLLCCNFLFGIISLIFSVQVKNRLTDGRLEQAKYMSKLTLIFNLIGTTLGLITWIFLLIQLNNFLNHSKSRH